MEYSFGTWIKRRRKALDLTQQQLAQEIGCSPSLIFKIESDERRPSRQMAELLAEKLDIPPEQRPNFLKTARQEKSIASLETIPPLSDIEPDSAPRQNPSNLPVSPTPLVGREHELNVITKQLLENPPAVCSRSLDLAASARRASPSKWRVNSKHISQTACTSSRSLASAWLIQCCLSLQTC